MSTTGLDVFDATIQKTNSWLQDVMEIGRWQDRHAAYVALRATLHTLRDRLVVDEVAQLAAQLPMLIRGLYYEGWDPSHKPLRLRHKAEFLERLARELRGDEDVDAERAAHAVFTTLERRVSSGEIDDIRSVLPSDVRELWPAA